MALSQLEAAVSERYGAPALEAARKLWDGEALPSANQAKLAYFVERGETSPQAAELPKSPENSKESLFGFVLKLLLYAGADWYEVVTGIAPPEPPANQFDKIGVAFDASSRLRRAGIELYHTRFAQTKMRCTPSMAMFVSSDGDASQPMPIAQLPPKAADKLRIVAISDTHLLHEGIGDLPPGDLLIHSGDLSYEESRSLDANKVEAVLGQGEAKMREALPNLDVLAALKWLGQAKQAGKFEHAVLTGGNHDFILEQLGAAESKKLCGSFGVTYLHYETAPVPLRFRKENVELTVYGTGASLAANKIDATRAVQSGNVAFGMDDTTFVETTKHVDKADIIVCHTPPDGKLLAKAGKSLPGVNALIERVQPTLFVCGHCHNGAPDLTKERATLMDRTLATNASILSTWNSLFGHPVVIDIPLPSKSQLTNQKEEEFRQYLQRHGVETALIESVKEVLKNRPDKPLAAIAEFLQNYPQQQ